MSRSFPDDGWRDLLERAHRAAAEHRRRFPGDRAASQPLETLYVPADRVTSTTTVEFGAEALRLLDAHAPDAAVVRGRVRRGRRGRGARTGARGRQARASAGRGPARRFRGRLRLASGRRGGPARGGGGPGPPDRADGRDRAGVVRAAGEVVRRRRRGAEPPDARHVRDDADRGRRRAARRVRRHVPEGHDARPRRAVRRGARTPGGGARARRARAAVRGPGRDAAVGDRPRRHGRGTPHPRRGRWAAHGDALRGVRLHRVAGADAVGAAARPPGERSREGAAAGDARRDRGPSERRFEQRRAGDRPHRGRARRVAAARRARSAFALRGLLPGLGPAPRPPRQPVRRRLRVAAPAPGRCDLARPRLAGGGRRGGGPRRAGDGLEPAAVPAVRGLLRCRGRGRGPRGDRARAGRAARERAKERARSEHGHEPPRRRRDPRAGRTPVRRDPDRRGARVRRRPAARVRRAPRRAARGARRTPDAARRGGAPGVPRGDPLGPRVGVDGRTRAARPAGPPRRDHRPHRPQDGDQRAQQRRSVLHGRPRGFERPDVVEHGRRPGEPRRRRPSHDRAHRPGRARVPSRRPAGDAPRSTPRLAPARTPPARRRLAGLGEPVRLRARVRPQRARAARARHADRTSTCRSSRATSRPVCGTTSSCGRRTGSGSRAARSARPS